MIRITFFLIALIGTFKISAQDKAENPSPIIFIYDASGSMWGQIQGKTKMEIAAGVLTASVESLPDNQKIGFVAYGHRTKDDCKDVEFLVDIENGTKSDVNRSVKGLKPLGKTPLAYSALLVIDKLRKTKLKGTIILVTDGIESCGGNICDVVKAAKKEGIDFKLHIIGFGIKVTDSQQLKCAAEAGNGNYYDAADAGGLGDVLNDATTKTVDEPDGNVTLYAVKNGIAIDALVKAYDIAAKRRPISVRTYRDTASLYLPPSKYNFEVTPLEGTDVNMIIVTNIESFDDKIIHKTISFDGGKLSIKTTNNGKDWDCLVKLFDQNGKVVSSARTYNAPKEVEVNPGIYKVTIQALGTMEGIHTLKEFTNVNIESGEVTPLSNDFKSGDFQIYTKVKGENIDAVVTIIEANSGKNLAGSRTYTRGAKFLLNPGTYKVKVVPIGVHKAKKTQIITMEVKQGELITKEVNF